MTEANNTTLLESATARKPGIFILAVAILLLVGALTVYLFMQKSALAAKSEQLANDLRVTKNEITILESQKIEAARLSQKYLGAIQKDEILWSKVINRIRTLKPLDAETNQDKVFFSSYNGSQGGKIAVNAVSRPTMENPYADVADLVRTFNKSSDFKDAYVPSITMGENDSGQKTTSFTLNMTYEENYSVDTSDDTSFTDGDGTSQPKISRQ